MPAALLSDMNVFAARCFVDAAGLPLPYRLLLPERRTERVFPRAVKIKMSNYPRKRPVKRRAAKKRPAK